MNNIIFQTFYYRYSTFLLLVIVKSPEKKNTEIFPMIYIYPNFYVLYY